VVVIIWFIKAPTDYIHNKAQYIKENKICTIVVNYDPSMQDK